MRSCRRAAMQRSPVPAPACAAHGVRAPAARRRGTTAWRRRRSQARRRGERHQRGRTAAFSVRGWRDSTRSHRQALPRRLRSASAPSARHTPLRGVRRGRPLICFEFVGLQTPFLGLLSFSPLLPRISCSSMNEMLISPCLPSVVITKAQTTTRPWWARMGRRCLGEGEDGASICRSVVEGVS